VSDLRYVGKGRHLVGIPATDLTAAEVEVLAERRGITPAALQALLVRSGLYSTKPSSAPAEK